MPSILKRPWTGGYQSSLVESLPNYLQVLLVFLILGAETAPHCWLHILKHRDLQTQSPWTNTNHQSVIKISSSASSIAFATSSKYPLALTYLKDKFCFVFVFHNNKNRRKDSCPHVLWQSQRLKPLPTVSTQPLVYFVQLENKDWK